MPIDLDWSHIESPLAQRKRRSLELMAKADEFNRWFSDVFMREIEREAFENDTE